MIEEITTNIVQCDGPNCDEVYVECVPNDANAIAALAKRDGWVSECAHDTAELWLCPACQSAASLLAKANEISVTAPPRSAPETAATS